LKDDDDDDDDDDGGRLMSYLSFLCKLQSLSSAKWNVTIVMNDDLERFCWVVIVPRHRDLFRSRYPQKWCRISYRWANLLIRFI